MLDVVSLDEGLKLKALGRLIVSKHPFIKIVRNFVNLSDFYFPVCNLAIESVTVKGVEVLAKYRESVWTKGESSSNRQLVGAAKAVKLKNIISRAGQSSFNYFRLWHQGRRKIGDLSLVELSRIERFIKPEQLPALKAAININVDLKCM